MSIIARDADDFPIFMVGTNSPAKHRCAAYSLPPLLSALFLLLLLSDCSNWVRAHFFNVHTRWANIIFFFRIRNMFQVSR